MLLAVGKSTRKERPTKSVSKKDRYGPSPVGVTQITSSLHVYGCGRKGVDRLREREQRRNVGSLGRSSGLYRELWEPHFRGEKHFVPAR